MCRGSESTRTTGSVLGESGPGIFGQDCVWKRRGVGEMRKIPCDLAAVVRLENSGFSARIGCWRGTGDVLGIRSVSFGLGAMAKSQAKTVSDDERSAFIPVA